MKNRILICGILFALVAMGSCNERSTPKPKAFSRIDRLDSGQQEYSNIKFSFLYSKEAEIEFVPSDKNSELWININYPRYNTTIHCTYIPLNRPKTLEGLLNDSYHLAYTHSSKANSITAEDVRNKVMDSSGLIYSIDGAVATPIQFYMTDSVRNFLRGSLYYNQIVDPDSVTSVTGFMRADILALMKSLEWEN